MYCTAPVLGHRRRPDVTMLDVMRPGSSGHSRHSRRSGRKSPPPLASGQQRKDADADADKDKAKDKFCSTHTLTTGQRHSSLSCCSCQAPQWPLAQISKLGLLGRAPASTICGHFPPLGQAANGGMRGRVRWVAWRNGARSHALLHLTLSPGNLLPPKNCARPITAF